MRRVALALFSTIAGLVTLLSFKTHPVSVASPPAAVSTTGPGSSSTSGSPNVPDPTSTAAGSSTSSPSTTSPSASSPSSSSSSSSAAKATSTTVTGDSIDTRFGPVQVTITVSHGRITSATAVDYPQNNPRDMEINAEAIPLLQQESVGQTSAAGIDMVSGATYTSDGYRQSLQSALDKA